MTDLSALDPARFPYEESYPPSLFGGGPITPPVVNDPTGVTPGEPGTFTPPGSDVPADLAALQALGALGQSAAWAAEAFVVLGDGSNATWDGAAWAVWTAAPPPPPPSDTPSASWTKAEIVDWLHANGDPAQLALTKDELLEHVANILDDETD